MNYDDDIPNGYGSLGGEGVENHDAVKTKVVQEGVANTLRCDKCGKGLTVTIPWAELIFMMERTQPPNQSWKYEPYNRCFMPHAFCPACRDQIRLGITPDECGRHVRAGMSAGLVSPQAVQQYVSQIRGGSR